MHTSRQQNATVDDAVTTVPPSSYIFLLRRLPPCGGGTEAQALTVVQSMDRMGYPARLLGGDVAANRVCRVPLSVYLPDSDVRVLGTLLFHVNLFIFLEKHRDRICGMCTFFLNETTIAAALWCRLRRKCLLFKVSGSGETGDFSRRNRSIRAGVAWRLVRKTAAAMVAVSHELVTEASRLGVPAVKVPNGIDTARFSPCTPAEPRPGSDAQRALCVGRLAPEKRFDRVISAIQALPDIHLTLVGTGPEEERLRNHAAACPAADRITFVGRCDDVLAHYRNTDVVIVSSDAEGLSNVMLEAMACGVPVITTPVSGAADAVTPENGIITSDFSETDLRRALTEFFARSQEQREAMGRHARETVVTRFDIANVAREYHTLFEGNIS